jgi:hypothetical protein
MYGAIIRAAFEVAAGMLIATLIVATAGPLTAQMAPVLADDNVLVLALEQLQQNFPLLLLLGAIFGLVARGVVESSLPGA